MNINKLQAQLQRVPDQALIAYVQNPDGQVPSYLALAELSRRKEIRKSAAPQQAAPTQTVAAQELAQAQPGIAQLPVREDMFNEASYASGGIVAFDEGGDVDTDMSRARYAINKVMTTPIPGSNTTINDGLVRAFPHLAGRFESTSPAFMGGGRGAMQGGDLNLNTASGLGRSRLANTDDVQVQYQPHVTTFLNNPSAMSGYAEGGEVKRFDIGGGVGSRLYKGLEALTPAGAFRGVFGNPYLSGAAGSAANVEQSYLDYVAKNLGLSQEQAAKVIAAENKPVLPYADPRVTADRNAAQIRADIEAGKYQTKEKPDRNVGDTQNIPAATSAVAPTNRVEFIPGADLSGEYDTMLRPEVSAQEAMAKYQGLMGTDVGRQKLNERLAAMETRAAKEEEQAPWMALARAGLGMAASGIDPVTKRRRSFTESLAEGAQAGLTDLANARERLANKEEKRFNIQSQLAQAERAEKVAAATYGLQSEEATKARNEANKLAKLGYKADRETSIAKGNFEASKANVSTDVEMAKIAEDKRYHDLWYKTNMEKTKRDAVTLEKSIMSNNTTQLKTLMSESGKLLKEMMDAGKDSSDPLYASTLRIYNGAADAMGLKAGINTTPPAATLPPLDSKSASKYFK